MNRIFVSSKGIALLFSVACVVLLAALNRITGQMAIDFLKYALPSFFTAQAAEDFGKSLGNRPPAQTTTNNITTVAPPSAQPVAASVVPAGTTLADVEPDWRGRK